MTNSFLWAPFLLFAFTSSATPGPNVIMLMSSGSAWGYKKSLPHLLGICFGFPLMLLIVQFGAGIVFEKLPWMFPLLTAFSLGYLFWLSVRILKLGFNGNIELSASQRPMTFWEAVMFQWINGKAWQIVISAATLFPTQEMSLRYFCALSFVIILFFVGTGWLEVGKRIARYLENPVFRRIYYSTLAASLIVSTFPTGISQLKSFLNS